MVGFYRQGRIFLMMLFQMPGATGINVQNQWDMIQIISDNE